MWNNKKFLEWKNKKSKKDVLSNETLEERINTLTKENERLKNDLKDLQDYVDEFSNEEIEKYEPLQEEKPLKTNVDDFEKDLYNNLVGVNK